MKRIAKFVTPFLFVLTLFSCGDDLGYESGTKIELTNRNDGFTSQFFKKQEIIFTPKYTTGNNKHIKKIDFEVIFKGKSAYYFFVSSVTAHVEFHCLHNLMIDTFSTDLILTLDGNGDAKSFLTSRDYSDYSYTEFASCSYSFVGYVVKK